ERQVLHPDAVAKDGAMAKRARGVNGDNADRLAPPPELGRECAGQCALAGTSAARNPNRVGAARAAVQLAQVLAAFRALAFDTADDAGERAPVALEKAFDDLRHAISSRCRTRTARCRGCSCRAGKWP